MAVEHRRDAVLRGRELDIRGIQRIMPHRYPMLLVDRVVEIEGDRKAIWKRSGCRYQSLR